MTQLTLEDTLEDHIDTVNIGGRTGRPHWWTHWKYTMAQLTLENALEDHNDTVNIGGRIGRPQ